MSLKELYEKETGKKWWINPVCHGDRGFYSNEYGIWLEQKAEAGAKAIESMDESLHLSKQLVYDEAFGGCVRKVILKWEKEINK